MNPIDIHANEEVHLKLRKYWIILARDTVATALLALIPFLLAGALGLSPLPFDFSGLLPFGALLTALWLLAVWLTLTVLWTNYYLDMWIVTNQRIVSVDQIGLFNRKITTLELENIQEITVHTRNVFETLLRFGTISIETAGPEDDVVMEGIPHPERIRTLVLEEANRFRKLEDENAQQKELLRTASHEMKNYLAKDAAVLAEIAEGVAAHPAMTKSLASRALSETRKGVHAMMGMLKDGKIELEAEPFDFAASVRALAETYRIAADKKGITLEIGAAGPVIVRGNEDALVHTVAKNILDNALTYTPSGTIRVLIEKTGPVARFVVADTGTGLDEDMKAKLFMPGGKGDDSSAINPASTGYGLSIIKQLVEAHGGRVWAESAGKGMGSTFIVELPAAE